MKPMISLLLTAVLVAIGVSAEAAFTPSVFYLAPEEPHPGDIVRVTMNMPMGSRTGTVTWNGKVHPGFVTGGLLNVYIGIDLGLKPGSYEISYSFGEESGKKSFTVVPKEFASESLTVDSKFTKLDEATLERVKEERANLRRIFATISPKRLWKSAFVKPAAGELGSPFGLRRVFNGEPRSPHAGIDIRASLGEGVYASNSGMVVVARNLFFTGNTVVIDHGQGLYSIYAHLSRIDVKEDEAVERSAQIGLVGATGRVTGPHLHWGVKLGGARVDPAMLPGRPL